MTAATILIVDDDRAELELMSRITSDAFPEANVRVAGDCALVHDMCSRESFDCILLDYDMPGMDGLSCAQNLRVSFPYLPIVLTTNVGDELLAARALTNGVTDYIPKSRITPQALRRTIEHAIQESGQARIIDEQRCELENFAYALAHDFRQPIRQIRTFTALISDALREGRSEGVEQDLAFLNIAARRLGELVDVMSQYTLLNQPPAIGDVDLNIVLKGVSSSLAPLIEESGARLIIGRAPVVRGNETLMTQVLQNLVINGLKYNKSAAPVVEVAAEAAPPHCLITVSDNGIGIEAEYFDEIFKPLARLHANAEYSGTGLGLTLARKALATQGGSLWCASKLGEGSQFFVKIPLAANLIADANTAALAG
jgi:signal transduction histidine kinase